MRPRCVSALVLGLVLLSARLAAAVSGLDCTADVHGTPVPVATGTVTLAVVEGAPLLPGSRVTADYAVFSNRRFRLVSTDVGVVTDLDPPPMTYDLVLAAAGTPLATEDACYGIMGMAPKLDVARLAQLAGGQLTLALQLPGGGATVMQGTLPAPSLTRKGCTKVCAPVLAVTCRARCAGDRRCLRTCRADGLAACRATGTCGPG